MDFLADIGLTTCMFFVVGIFLYILYILVSVHTLVDNYGDIRERIYNLENKFSSKRR